MIAHEKNFQSYLRGEVEIAGQRYEHSVAKVFALLDAPKVQPDLDLLDATQALRDDLRLYSGAIRRMASFAAHQSTLKHLPA